MVRTRISKIILTSLVIFALFSMTNVVETVRAEIATLEPAADSYVDSGHPTSNYGESIALCTHFWDFYIDDVRMNTYLKFDLSEFSNEIHDISSATLYLYASLLYGSLKPTTDVAVHSCSSTTWQEFEITWNNAPSYSPTPFDVTAVGIEERWYSWDITELVKNNLGNEMTLVLTATDVGDSFGVYFRSLEWEYNIPELDIEYVIIPEFPPFLILPLFMITTLFAVTIYRRKYS